MDFIDEIRKHKSHVLIQKDTIRTEEGTKLRLIQPFIIRLGYDITDGAEVIPEFTAAPGTSKDARVDYAIIKNGDPIIIIECKQCGEDLDKHYNQLCGYFAFTKVKFAVLSDGIVYRFYSDIDETNKMDERPFFEFNVLEHADDKNIVEKLKQFTKEAFDVGELITKASALKYADETKRIFREQLESPSDDFIDFFLSQVLPGQSKTKKMRDKFKEPLKNALMDFINDRIREKITEAIREKPTKDELTTKEIETVESDSNEGIVTTDEELASLYIVKSILHGIINWERVNREDFKGHCNIRLVSRHSNNDGYSRFNFILASAVVKCQSTLAPTALRCNSH
ncbi:type I restriction enzyme HsdR N-terminal domain-containing protein [bacterium]|nr:type I restriction enzyme HsdR N-terminal domain-containing protein [bacterium]